MVSCSRMGGNRDEGQQRTTKKEAANKERIVVVIGVEHNVLTYTTQQ